MVSSGKVAQVGRVSISARTLLHWMTVLAPEHFVPDPPDYARCVARQEALEPESVKTVLREECQHRYESIKQRALDFVISSRWLIGEAAEEGLSVGGARAGQRLREGKVMALLGDGASVADKRFMVETEMAATVIEQRLKDSEPRITRAQIVGFYWRHIARYKHPERRVIAIVEHIPTAAQARKIRLAVASGKADIRKIGIHELVVDRHPIEFVPGKVALARAIFATKLDVLSPLLLFDRQYAFFEVTGITRASVQPLAQVRGAIAVRLAAELHRRTLARFVLAWRQKWSTRTACRPGYVIQKCRQYRGLRAPEDPLALLAGAPGESPVI
jgi:parvulin-like peptidyl-prolyl cis-trans isomerase-like protein